MSMSEFKLWLAYSRIDPIGQWRGDLQAGVIAATVANCHSRKHRYKPADFMPKFEPKQADEEMEALAMVFAKVHNKAFGKKAAKSGNDSKP